MIGNAPARSAFILARTDARCCARVLSGHESPRISSGPHFEGASWTSHATRALLASHSDSLTSPVEEVRRLSLPTPAELDSERL
jgi:hypothetical protein